MASYEPPPGYTTQPPPNNTMALVSLVTGILGLTFLPFLGSIVAVIAGGMARREIRSSLGAQTGENLATIGIVLGWIGIALGVLGLCGVAVAFIVPTCLVTLGLMAEGQSFLLPTLVGFLW